MWLQAVSRASLLHTALFQGSQRGNYSFRSAPRSREYKGRYPPSGGSVHHGSVIVTIGSYLKTKD